MLHNVRCRNKCGNKCSLQLQIFFLIQFVKKQEITLTHFFICFSKPLDLSLIRFKKKSKYNSRRNSRSSKGSMVNPIYNAPISNLVTGLESLYNFLSEYIF